MRFLRSGRLASSLADENLVAALADLCQRPGIHLEPSRDRSSPRSDGGEAAAIECFGHDVRDRDTFVLDMRRVHP